MKKWAHQSSPIDDKMDLSFFFDAVPAHTHTSTPTPTPTPSNHDNNRTNEKYRVESIALLALESPHRRTCAPPTKQCIAIITVIKIYTKAFVCEFARNENVRFGARSNPFIINFFEATREIEKKWNARARH